MQHYAHAFLHDLQCHPENVADWPGQWPGQKTAGIVHITRQRQAIVGTFVGRDSP